MKVRFNIEYKTQWGESLTLVLGERTLPMSWGEGGIWSVVVDDCTSEELLDYQYQVIEDGIVKRCEWTRHSRRLDRRRKSHDIQDSWIEVPPGCPFVRKHQAELFDHPGFRAAGVAVPIFSLRSEDDFGIGEFRDLHALTDWASKVGLRIIQLLPVNDTTRQGEWKDSYPYSPISSFALHPLYLRLQDIGVQEDSSFLKEKEALNSLDAIDYPRVFKAKMRYIIKAFKKNRTKDLKSKSFLSFKAQHEELWLKEYAEFCAQRDSLDPDLYRWVQWHLFSQFAQEADYARSKGVYFKGDLPIGVSADSADAYWHPELFNLDSCAGAPPDFFSQDGQNWGFPTYNWDAMETDNYAWWKSRLKVMSRFFDAFRIDHILGFFRIWEIPLEHSSGQMGHFNPALPYSKEEIDSLSLPLDGLFHEDPRHPGKYQPFISPDCSRLEWWQKERFDSLYIDFFYHRHEAFWKRNAEKKLPSLLGATGMLACGEDLGMVPDCVNSVMEHESILSLEMTMMDKGRPWPYLSVCATSSHDMGTLRMQHYESRGCDLDCGRAYDIIKSHIDSPSMLAIFPIQDWIALDEGLKRRDFLSERINDPSNAHNKWQYRMHLNLCDLSAHASFCEKIKYLLKTGNR